MNLTDYDIKGYKPKKVDVWEDKGVLLLVILIIAMFVLSAYVHFNVEPQVAHAADVTHLDPSLLNTTEAQCDYAQLYPNKIRNFNQMKKDCASDGYPI